MKRFVIILCVLCFSFNEICRAQDNPSRLSIDVFVQPNLSYKFGKGMTTMPNEKMKLGFSFGTILNYQLNEKFVLSTGLNLINRGYSYSTSGLLFVEPSDPPLNEVKEFTFRTNYNYISVPLKAGYLFSKGNKFEFIVNAGFCFDYLAYIKRKTIIEYTDGSIDRKSNTLTISDGTKRFGVSSDLGLDIIYKFNENWNLLISPNVNVLLTNIQKDSNYQLHFWNTGIKIGIRRNL